MKYFLEVDIPCVVKPKTDSVMHISSFLVLQKIGIDYNLPDIPGECAAFFPDLPMYMVIEFSNVMQFVDCECDVRFIGDTSSGFDEVTSGLLHVPGLILIVGGRAL